MTRHKNLVGRKASRHHQFFPKTVFTHAFFLTAQTRLYTCCCCCCLFAWLKEKKKKEKKEKKKEKNLLFDYYKLLISRLAQMTLLCPIDVETPIELALLATRIAIKVINNPLRKCLLHNFVVHSLFLLYWISFPAGPVPNCCCSPVRRQQMAKKSSSIRFSS